MLGTNSVLKVVTTTIIVEDTTTSVVGWTKTVKTNTSPNVDVNPLPEEKPGKLTVKMDQTLVPLKESVETTLTSVNGTDLIDFDHLHKLMNFIFV